MPIEPSDGQGSVSTFVPSDWRDTQKPIDSVPVYVGRFIDEYTQLRERIEKLADFLVRIEASQYDTSVDMPEPNCPVTVLQQQLRAMQEYLHVLQVRAKIEQITL